jgi:hypothetical protein
MVESWDSILAKKKNRRDKLMWWDRNEKGEKKKRKNGYTKLCFLHV